MTFVVKWILVVTISGTPTVQGTYDTRYECQAQASAYGPMAYCMQAK